MIFVLLNILILKYVKILLLKSSIVQKYDFFFIKYIFDDQTIRMLMYTNFSDLKK